MQQFASDPSDPHAVRQRWRRQAWILGVLIFLAPIPIQALLNTSNPGTAPLRAVVTLLIWGVGFTWLIRRTRAVNRRARDAGAPGKAAWDAHWAELTKQHQAAMAEWQHQGAEHHSGQQHRLTQLPEWGAVRPTNTTRRIDLYGGTPLGWQALVTTLGASLLGSGERLFVLDLSEADVAALLFRAAAEIGVPTRAHVLPEHMESLDVLGGLGPAAVKDTVLEALHASRAEVDRAGRSLDDRILSGICEVLAPTITLERISASLRVLLRDEPPPSGDGGPLTGEEWDQLSELFNAEYRQVISYALVSLESQLYPLRSLGRRPVDGDGAAAGARCEGVAVSRSGGAVVNDMLVDILIQATIGRLRRASQAQDRSQVIIVIGADILGRRHLEKLDDLAAALGTRVVYLFRHLREDVLDVAGGGGAVAGIMRPGNHKEAEQAASVIGKGYKFVLSQMTRTIGTTDTTSWGDSRSVSETRAWTQFSRSLTEGESQETSRGTSEQSGTTMQRVNEYVVEPEALRALPSTALLLVEFSPAAQQRRVRVVDCNPALVTRPRVSALPFVEQPDALASAQR